MDASKQVPELRDVARASREELDEALVHWDELDARSLGALATHPLHGRRLRALQRAEAWLTEAAQGEAQPAPGPCPEAEELFDHGRGPGARPLPEVRRSEIELHLAACTPCRELVATLASPPPLPLDTEPERVPAPARAAGPAPIHPGPGAGRRWLRWAVPLAAAAGLVVLARTQIASDPLAGLPPGLPAGPLLRGEDPGALLFPRHALLEVDAPGTWHGLAGAIPRFELLPPAEASHVRIELARQDGGAFSAGEPLETLELEPDAARPVSLAGPILAPGRYTWRAWARVRGLERELGSRDFVVRADPELEARLAALAGTREPRRTEAAVRLLHEAGYLAQARELARTLPAGAQRDEYLQRLPGR